MPPNNEMSMPVKTTKWLKKRIEKGGPEALFYIIHSYFTLMRSFRIFFDCSIGGKLETPNFHKIGGTHGKNFRGLLPAGETAFFLLFGGQPAMRMGDSTLHGGTILSGNMTVLIG